MTQSYQETQQNQTDQVQTDQTDQTNDQVIQTSIAQVNATPEIIETSNFQSVLQEIPRHVARADDLLKAYREDRDTFLQNNDEETLDQHLKEMQHVTSFMRDIEDSRKEIRQYLNGVRDRAMNWLDQRLNDASYGELSRAESDIKQLKKDIEADRREARWEEIRETFVANVNRYPLISEFAPELTDFSKFKLMFPKLISGAKTRKVKEADHTTVNEALYNWNTAIELMKENEWGLSVQDLNQLLTMFKQNPSIELVEREGRQLKKNAEAREKARQEAEQRRREQERQAELDRQRQQEEMRRVQAQQEEAKRQQDARKQQDAERQRQQLEQQKQEQMKRERQMREEYEQFNSQYSMLFKESFPEFIKYLFQNQAYHNVHSSPQTKASVIYDIMRQVENPNSVVTKETNKDPQKVLDLVRYILDA